MRDQDTGEFRQVLGHFCTGVTVITTHGPHGPAGFACQAFAALSLAPPLVLFCPSRTSATWPVIERAGHFCANVLADGQQELARRFGTTGTDKFAGVPWSPSPSGPILDGALTWVECAVEAVHEAGDHFLVTGQVTALGPSRAGRPLLFYRGRYAATDPGIRADGGGRHAAGLAAACRLDVKPGAPGRGPGAPEPNIRCRCRPVRSAPGPVARAAASSSASCRRS